MSSDTKTTDIEDTNEDSSSRDESLRENPLFIPSQSDVDSSSVSLDLGGAGDRPEQSCSSLLATKDAIEDPSNDKTIHAGSDIPKINILSPVSDPALSTNNMKVSDQEIGSDNRSKPSESLDQVDQAIIVNVDTKALGNKLLEPVSRSGSPKTPISTDECSSDDLVLKWDDDEEVQSLGNEATKAKENDNAVTNKVNLDVSDEKKKQKTVNNLDDLIEQLDQQISELDNMVSKINDVKDSKFKDSFGAIETNKTKTVEEPKSPAKLNTGQSRIEAISEFDDIEEIAIQNSVDKIIDKLETTCETSDVTNSVNLNKDSKETSNTKRVNDEDSTAEKSSDTPGVNNEFKHSKVDDAIEPMDADQNETTFENEDIANVKAAANSTVLDLEENVNKTIEELSETIQSSDETLIEPREHNLNKTDMMIEIPTQELIDCMDESVEISKTGVSVSEDVLQNKYTDLLNQDRAAIEENITDTDHATDEMSIEINSQSIPEKTERKTSKTTDMETSESVEKITTHEEDKTEKMDVDSDQESKVDELPIKYEVPSTGAATKALECELEAVDQPKVENQSNFEKVTCKRDQNISENFILSEPENEDSNRQHLSSSAQIPNATIEASEVDKEIADSKDTEIVEKTFGSKDTSIAEEPVTSSEGEGIPANSEKLSSKITVALEIIAADNEVSQTQNKSSFSEVDEAECDLKVTETIEETSELKAVSVAEQPITTLAAEFIPLTTDESSSNTAVTHENTERNNQLPKTENLSSSISQIPSDSKIVATEVDKTVADSKVTEIIEETSDLKISVAKAPIATSGSGEKLTTTKEQISNAMVTDEAIEKLSPSKSESPSLDVEKTVEPPSTKQSSTICEEPSKSSEHPSSSEQLSTISEQPSISSEQPSTSSEQPSKSLALPSTSSEQPLTRYEQPSTSSVQPSTSSEQLSTGAVSSMEVTDVKSPEAKLEMEADPTDEGLDITDSLGLLAESSRVVEDDEEQETSEHDEADDDDDFDPDDGAIFTESSNQMTPAEMSEDSNAQLSEADLPKIKLLDTMPDDNAQDYLEKDLGTPPDGLGETPDGLSTPPEAVDDADATAVEPTEEPSIEDFINKVDEISEVDAEMLDEVEDLSPSDVQVSPAADDDAVEEDIECAFAICNVVSETADKKDLQFGAENDKAKDEKLTKESSKPEENVEASTTEALKSKEGDNEEQIKSSLPTVEGETSKSEGSMLKMLLVKERTRRPKSSVSPSKISQLGVAKPKDVISIVDLGESSSEDEAQDAPEVTSVTADVAATSEVVPDVSTQVVGKPTSQKSSKNYGLNLDEISIKTGAITKEPLVIPETKVGEPARATEDKDMEVFNLDSDDEEHAAASEPPPPPSPEPVDPSQTKCINPLCDSGPTTPVHTADRLCVAYYDQDRKKRGFVCIRCAAAVADRTKRLIDGVRELTPLLEMDMGRRWQELVEISDSESDSEPGETASESSRLGEAEAEQVEDKLVKMINSTWEKFNMDARLGDTQAELNAELERLDKESKEIDAMLRECQAATDKLRSELYSSFEHDTQSLPALTIYDTPDTSFIRPELVEKLEETQSRDLKRRLSSTSEKPPPKRPSLPAPSDENISDTKDAAPMSQTVGGQTIADSKLEDDKDISVVTLSAESAPADLPPAGELTRAPLRVGMPVYAMRNAFGSWLRARIFEVIPKSTTVSSNFTMCRVKFDHKNHKNQYKNLPARCLAYSEPADVRMTIGTRLIALFKDPTNVSQREAYYSGIVAEVPNPVNNYRYLVFFDDGYAQYVQHCDTRLVAECSPRVWEEVHPFSREFVREYLTAYPERPMVRLHTGQSLKTEWNGKWWVSRVTKVDASLVQVHFEKDNRTEWIYRGSTRLAPLYLELQAAERHRARPTSMPRNRMQSKLNMPYVEYTRSDDAAAPGKPDSPAAATPQYQTQTQIQQQEELRRAQRAVAKKSVGAVPPPAHPPAAPAPDTVTSRVVYYTPKNAVKPHKMVLHNCGPHCRRSDVLKLHELRTYNPLAKPLLSGWERQLVRFKGHKEVMYRAPCGRRLRNIRELHRYLRLIQSDMGVDLFDFGPNTHCLAEFVLNNYIIAKKDLSNGKENVPVPCVNYYDKSLPEFYSYNTERTPTDGVPLNLDPEFLCGCDCTDDCEDKSKCACWQLTLEGARTIGLSTRNVGYSYKRLPEPLPSGIYECNSRCKCKSTCLNRVAQQPLQLKLQVFKTLNRGWGIRALNDVPKGSFLCVYAGNLLTDATANLDGLNEGDEYLAELDYIEVVEQMKEGYEEDIPDADKRLDKKELGGDSSTTEESSEDEIPSKDEKEDGDFQVPYMNIHSEFRKTLRKREKKEKKDQKESSGESKKDKDSGKEGEEDCITISDDEEVREPSRFAAQPGMGREFVSKYKSLRSYFGKDEACYIMDAKVQGNIGRYLNHSCSPNVFVQNVFVDTHDPRFPWVAFFALLPIRAGTELTWNYNYDVGSVPGKVLYCYCGASNCRGRLL